MEEGKNEAQDWKGRGDGMKQGQETEEIFETNWELEVNKFDDMGLKEEVLRGIYGYGFKDPSPIQ